MSCEKRVYNREEWKEMAVVAVFGGGGGAISHSKFIIINYIPNFETLGSCFRFVFNKINIFNTILYT